MKKLWSSELSLIDTQSLKISSVLARTGKKVTEFTFTRKMCLTRAIIESQRHWCSRSLDNVTNKHNVVSKHELVATLLDVRTLGCSHATNL